MRNDILESKEFILECIEKLLPKVRICHHFNCKPATLDRYLKILNIEYIGNRGGKYFKIHPKIKCDHYFNDTKYIHTYKLKHKLIEESYKKHQCEMCGGTSWMGIPIPIELHHIDGNNFNNKLENLQILCPNCHTLTDNYRGKGMKKKTNDDKKLIIKNKNIEKKIKCPICKINDMKYKSKRCLDCYKKSQIKNEIPPLQILIKYVYMLGYEKTGKKYNVSGNSIRKWIKKYKKSLILNNL